MENNDIKIELPSRESGETEFFLQSAPPNTVSCSAHIHNVVELLYVREGSYTVMIDDMRYEISEGDLILFCSGAIHHVVAGDSEQNSYYVIKIPPSFFMDFAMRNTGAEYTMRFALNRKESKCVWCKSELEGSEIKQILDELINEEKQGRYASEVGIRLKIMELLLAILRDDVLVESVANDNISLVIYSAMSYVQEKFAEDIDEHEVAHRYGISYSYFSRNFKRVTGMTFKNYLNRTRISKAEQLLLCNGSSVSEIATACGYNSVSYFINVYRSITGKTPYKALKTEK